MNNPTKILIISHEWPPRASMGVQRAYGFARELEKMGFNITVLTTKKYPQDRPFNRPKTITAIQARVIELPYLPTFFSVLSPRFIKALQKIFVLAGRLYLKKSDRNFSFLSFWVKESVRFLKNDGQKYDIVISTYSPFECHVLASCLKEARIASKWVADYRDLFSDSELDSSLKSASLKESELGALSSRADLITAASVGFTEILGSKFGIPAVTVYNGWDEEFHSLVKRWRAQNTRAKLNENITIAFFGSIYWENMAWLEFFDSVKYFNNSRRGQFVINIFGNHADSNKNVKYIKKHFDFVRFFGRIDHSSIPEVICRSDLLLAFSANVSYGKGVVPGKIFECLVSGRPTIIYGKNSSTEAGSILDSTGCGKEITSPPAIIAELNKLAANRLPDWYQPNLVQINKYSREYSIKKLVSQLSCWERDGENDFTV